MIKLSFTQFLNFAIKNGAPKLTAVKKIKEGPAYHPAIDYWKEFRDKVRYIHSNNKDINELDSLLTEINTKKIPNYRTAINNYKNFVKGLNVKWFDPPKASYSYGGVMINVNHELGLYINGQPYLIKMILSKDGMKFAKKNNLNTTLALSYLATEYTEIPENTKSKVLIVSKKKPYDSEYPSKDSIALLNSEIGFFESLYNSI